ncbi:Hypothetical predicted protein [Prunus dulcis]|uniref:Uncharacterized protein n=1 Tax=Prunus dulcis TaxID=3755 RepID=A0A5E4FEF5_PRUDU|nr:Hypothetical predicted protein [Prunus dulcis]
MGSNEVVEEEGGLAITGEEEVGLVQLGTGGIGENELGSYEVVAGNAEPYRFSVEVFEDTLVSITDREISDNKHTETNRDIEERERDSHGSSRFSIRSMGLSLHFLSFENPSGYGGKLEMEAMQFSA